MDRLIRFSGLVFVVATVCLVLSWFLKGNLPPPNEIDEHLLQEPVQKTSERETFVLSYRGGNYIITPVAEYEIWGLVVSHNNINSLGDMYHNKDSVDIKDLALIWGSNVDTPDYQRVKFRSNSYVVYFRYPSNTKFDHYKISNNHLLAGNARVRKRIKDMTVGDQVRLKGMLVNYEDAKTGAKRNTSTTRTDTEMGACEVMFVEEAELLRPSRDVWSMVFRASMYITIASSALLVLAFIIKVAREQAQIRRD